MSLSRAHASRVQLVLLVIVASILPSPSVALEEGDSCKLKNDIPAVCRAASKCEPIISKYIKTGRLTVDDVPTCGFNSLEEIVCCPSVECCSDEPSQVTTTSTTTTTTTKRPTTTTTRRSTTSTTTTTTTVRSQSKLDEQSGFFDFQQILNKKTPTIPTQSPIQERRRVAPQFRSIPMDDPRPTQRPIGFQTVGQFGSVDSERVPGRRIVNRPQAFPVRWPATGTVTWPFRQSEPLRMPEPEQQNNGDLIHLVNERLRQQGMNIMPANEVTTFQLPSSTPPTTTTIKPTVAPVDLDPWAPFRFRPNNQDNVINTNHLGDGEHDGDLDGFALQVETTTTVTLQPTPTSRVDVSERAAVRACRKIQQNEKRQSLTKHILDGVPVDDGVYPHMAAIAISGFGKISYSCGGSLISKRHVLTAAHCVNSQYETPVHVRLGTVNIENVNDHYQDIPITPNIKIHPDYISTSKYSDIAILELAEDAKLSYYIYPACVETSLADPPERSKLFVSGWGVMNRTNRVTSKILLRAPLDIVPISSCNESYKEQPSSERFLQFGITEKLVCAADTREGKKDSCQGDSGGPLVIETDIENSMYSILGVVSSGFGCATKTPGIYTRVASYLDFIESVVWPNNVVD